MLAEFQVRKLKFMCIIMAFLFVSLVITDTEVSAESSNNSDSVSEDLNSKDEVTPDEAHKAISNFVAQNDELSEMRGAEFKFKHNLYGVQDEVIAYYFSVLKGEEEIGYFITSASKYIDPLLEYGFGSENESFQEQVNSGYKIYYLGATNFRYAKNKTELQEVHEKLKKNALAELSVLSSVSSASDQTQLNELKKGLESTDLVGIKKEDTVSPGWDNLLNNKQITGDSNITATRRVLSVDRIWQRRSGTTNKNSSCGPAVGSMIADYYHDVKNYKVRDNAYYGSWAKLTNHLYKEMDSTFLGTTMNNWREGMYNHVRHDSNSWEERQFRGVGNGSAFISAIDSTDPAGIRFDLFVHDGVGIKYHFVTGIGYNKNGSYTGDLHIAYKDPDNGENNSGTKWLDWTVNDQDFSFAYMK